MAKNHLIKWKSDFPEEITVNALEPRICPHYHEMNSPVFSCSYIYYNSPDVGSDISVDAFADYVKEHPDF